MRLIQRFLGLAFLLLCIAQCAVLISSLKRSFSVMPGDTAYIVEAGVLQMNALTPGRAFTTTPREFTITPCELHFSWLPQFSANVAITHIEIPLYLTAGACGLIAWRLLGRTTLRSDRCPRCHYSRTGLPAASPCPECGTPQRARSSETAAPTADVAHA